MKEYDLEEKELGEFNAVISGVLIPELIRIADKYSYNRDSMIKFAADTLTAMSELATFERYKAAIQGQKVRNEMTREEAIAHGKEQLEVFGGEHAEFIKLAIKALEQESILDKIRAEIADLDDADYDYEGYYKAVTDALQIIDKYKTESEDKE